MGKNSLNNFMCHLSSFQKLSPVHTHPLKTIREFLKPYELLFSELESLVKCNHKIRVQECYGGRAMSCPWHGGVEAYGGPLSVDMQPYSCFIYLLDYVTWTEIFQIGDREKNQNHQSEINRNILVYW